MVDWKLSCDIRGHIFSNSICCSNSTDLNGSLQFLHTTIEVHSKRGKPMDLNLDNLVAIL
jgi:hypothetical protein